MRFTEVLTIGILSEQLQQRPKVQAICRKHGMDNIKIDKV
jgi:hypothetical protein